MTPHRNALPVPPAAAGSDTARELVRVWAANGQQHVSLLPGIWEDPAAWGLMLVDLARHIASSYEQQHGLDRTAVLSRIREALDAEWAYPTDEAHGNET